MEAESEELGSRRSRESFGFDSGRSVCAIAAGAMKIAASKKMHRMEA